MCFALSPCMYVMSVSTSTHFETCEKSMGVGTPTTYRQVYLEKHTHKNHGCHGVMHIKLHQRPQHPQKQQQNQTTHTKNQIVVPHPMAYIYKNICIYILTISMQAVINVKAFVKTEQMLYM